MLDGFIGAEYRRGLEKLKAVVEKDRGPARVVPQTPPVPPVVPQAAPQAAEPTGGESVAPQRAPAPQP